MYFCEKFFKSESFNSSSFIKRNNVKNVNKNMPEVSVVLTVFNREQYLKRCIDSLLLQSFNDWELIAIDDGSQDGSFNILKNYALNFDKIMVLRQANMKLPLSRNKGIFLSTGKFITFLDSDDEYKKDHLLKRVTFMNENPNVDLIHGGVKIIGYKYVRDKNNPANFIHLSKCTIGATLFGKRNVFLELNGFRNINYSEDSDFVERAEKKFNVKKVNYKTYVYYRNIPESITNTFQP
jgi:glycosyltransferase involved in cell wall biosynthesis